METTSPRDRDQQRWREERLRYEVLLRIGEAAAETGGAVDGRDIQSACEVPFEHLCRIIVFLADHGYLDYLGAGPRVFITPKGVDCLLDSERRESVRV